MKSLNLQLDCMNTFTNSTFFEKMCSSFFNWTVDETNSGTIISFKVKDVNGKSDIQVKPVELATGPKYSWERNGQWPGK